jgi:hypothetical protein
VTSEGLVSWLETGEGWVNWLMTRNLGRECCLAITEIRVSWLETNHIG